MDVDNGFYKIGTRNRVLPQRFTRNQLEPSINNFIELKDVPDTETSFRSAVGADSMTGTQGHKHCNCTGDCDTKRCACKKAENKCNSRCHLSNPCANK